MARHDSHRSTDPAAERSSRPDRERDRRGLSNGERRDADYDERGIHDERRHEYRGRESYEQQRRAGRGGESGVFDQRDYPHDRPGPNYREQSAGRNDPDYGSDQYRRSSVREREAAWNDYNPDDYSRTDYGKRGYASHPERDGLRANWGGYRSQGSRQYWPSESYDQSRYVTSQHEPGGSQRGRGPKGYKRSDERIREDVCDRLSEHHGIDASDVEVAVSNAEVTLTGTVADRDLKFRIERVADAVSGVNEVHNSLRICRTPADSH